jgi:xanthine dehydrogenase molybdopterin-binding subunit B
MRRAAVLAKSGDVEAGSGKAAKVLTRDLSFAFQSSWLHRTVLRGADVRADGTTLWCGTQTPYGTREAVAKFLGLPNERVRLIYTEASGCYGQKRRGRRHHRRHRAVARGGQAGARAVVARR